MTGSSSTPCVVTPGWPWPWPQWTPHLPLTFVTSMFWNICFLLRYDIFRNSFKEPSPRSFPYLKRAPKIIKQDLSNQKQNNYTVLPNFSRSHESHMTCHNLSSISVMRRKFMSMKQFLDIFHWKVMNVTKISWAKMAKTPTDFITLALITFFYQTIDSLLHNIISPSS